MSSWLEKPGCTENVTAIFFPGAVATRLRQFLTFKGICPGETLPSCCFAGHCSSLAFIGPDGHLRCATPLLKSGQHTVSLWFETENRSVLFERKLDVGGASQTSRTISLYQHSYDGKQFRFRVRSQEVLPDIVCCGYVALSPGMDVMGITSPSECGNRHFDLPAPPPIVDATPFREAPGAPNGLNPSIPQHTLARTL